MPKVDSTIKPTPIPAGTIPHPSNVPGGILGETYQTEYLTEQERELFRGSPTNMTPSELFERQKTVLNSDNQYLRGWWEDWHTKQGGHGSASEKDRVAYKTLKQGQGILGRDLTVDEYTEGLTFFEGANGDSVGREYYQNLKKTEDEDAGDLPGGDGGGVGTGIPPVYNPDTDTYTDPDTGEEVDPGDWDQDKIDQYNKYSDDIAQMYEAEVGRPPDQIELDALIESLSSGDYNMMQIREGLRNTQEYIDIQDKQFATEVGEDIGGIGDRAIEKYSPAILSKYVKGGIQHGPALDQAMADLMADIESRQTGFLADLKVGQYGGNKAYAQQGYQADLNRFLAEKGYGRQRSDQYADALRNRAWNSQDVGVMNQMYGGGLGYMDGGQQSFPWGKTVGTMAGLGAGMLIPGASPVALGMFGGGGGSIFDALS